MSGLKHFWVTKIKEKTKSNKTGKMLFVKLQGEPWHQQEIIIKKKFIVQMK